METTNVLIVIGVIGVVVLVLVAIRGSFKSDDDFYGESTTVAGGGPSAERHDEGRGDASDDGAGDGGTSVDGDGSGDGSDD